MSRRLSVLICIETPVQDHQIEFFKSNTLYIFMSRRLSVLICIETPAFLNCFQICLYTVSRAQRLAEVCFVHSDGTTHLRLYV